MRINKRVATALGIDLFSLFFFLFPFFLVSSGPISRTDGNGWIGRRRQSPSYSPIDPLRSNPDILYPKDQTLCTIVMKTNGVIFYPPFLSFIIWQSGGKGESMAFAIDSKTRWTVCETGKKKNQEKGKLFTYQQWWLDLLRSFVSLSVKSLHQTQYPHNLLLFLHHRPFIVVCRRAAVCVCIVCVVGMSHCVSHEAKKRKKNK